LIESASSQRKRVKVANLCIFTFNKLNAKGRFRIVMYADKFWDELRIMLINAQSLVIMNEN